MSACRAAFRSGPAPSVADRAPESKPDDLAAPVGVAILHAEDEEPRERSAALCATTSMTTLVRCWLVLVFSGLLGSATAHADDPLAGPVSADARKHFLQGNRLYRIREFAKAIEEYKTSVLIEDKPVLFYNLAQCYRQLGNHGEALWYYEQFLRRGKPTGELKDIVEKFIEQMKQMKAEQDKKAVTQPPAVPATSRGRVPPAAQTTPLPLPAPPLQAPATTREPWHRDRVGLAITAVGVIASGVSGALFLSARSLEAEANREDHDLHRIALRDRVETRRLTGTIAGIAGAGLIIGGIVKLAIGPARTAQARPTVGVAMTNNEVVVVGHFAIP